MVHIVNRNDPKHDADNTVELSHCHHIINTAPNGITIYVIKSLNLV